MFTTMIRLFIFIFTSLILVSCDEFGFSHDSNSGSESTGTGGSMARFTVKGDYLYVLTDASLQTYDISDSSRLDLKSSINLNVAIETIFPSGNYLFMGSTTGMLVYDLDNPFKPEYVSSYSHFTSCDPVIVDGNYAYVTLRSNPNIWSCTRSINELQVIDISNIKNPVKVSSYSMENPKGLALANKTLFICDGLDLVVMDAKNPLKLEEIKRYEMDGTPYDVIAKDGVLTVSYSEGLVQYSYVGDSIQMLSVLF